ncbi:hypothetical protein HMPREF3199_00097 [Enterococcus faecium]|jgi:hypothetical protein|nr:hypothetical protein HMPREF3199_00097 [Enterococcus faecium]
MIVFSQIKIICIFTFGIMNLRIIIITVVIGMVLMCGQCMTKKESDLLFLMLYWYWIEERGAALGGSPFFINPILLLS